MAADGRSESPLAATLVMCGGWRPRPLWTNVTLGLCLAQRGPAKAPATTQNHLNARQAASSGQRTAKAETAAHLPRDPSLPPPATHAQDQLIGEEILQLAELPLVLRRDLPFQLGETGQQRALLVGHCRRDAYADVHVVVAAAVALQELHALAAQAEDLVGL